MVYSLIVCVRNEAKNITEFLESVQNLKLDHTILEVIIVDDHSTDSTIKVAHESALQLKLKVVANAGSGVAAARNTGISLAQGEVILFSDCDGILNSDCLTEIKRVLNFPETDIAQGNIWSQYYRSTANNWLSIWRKTVFKHKMMNKDSTLKSINGRLVAIKSEFINKFSTHNSLFDSSFGGGGGEDRECGQRMYEAGAKIRLADKAIIYHKDPPSIKAIITKKFKNGIADCHAGVGERWTDTRNFKRAVIEPFRQGVPLWFALSLWLSYMLGNSVSRLKKL